MIEKTTHPAGFRVVDRRAEHRAPSPGGVVTVVDFATEPAPPAEEFDAMVLAVDKPGWYRIEGGHGKTPSRLRRVHRSGPDTPPPPPTLAEIKHARSVLAGARGTYATPLDADDRTNRYAVQELCRCGVGTPGYRPLTPRQERRIRHKANRAMRPA